MQCTNRYKKKNKDKNKINWFFFSHSIKFWLSILRFHSQIIWTRTKELTKVEKILNKHIWIINQCSEFISNLENFYILLIMKKRKRECLKSVLFYCWKPYPRGICSHSLCDQLCTRRNEVPKNVKKSTERIGWKWTNEESFWIETKLSRFFDVIFDTSSFLLRLPLIGSLLARFKNSTDSRRQLLLKMVQIEWANKTVDLLLMAKTKLRWTELNDSIFEAMQIRYVNDFIPKGFPWGQIFASFTTICTSKRKRTFEFIFKKMAWESNRRPVGSSAFVLRELQFYMFCFHSEFRERYRNRVQPLT